MTTQQFKQARNTVTCKLIIEPRVLEFKGPSADNRGLGIFANVYQTPDSNEVTSQGERTRSEHVYSIRMQNDLAPDVKELRVSYSRFSSFKDIFGNASITEAVKSFFSHIEEGKARLMNTYGEKVPLTAVQQLVSSMKEFNVGKCYRVQLVLNRHSDLPFDKSRKTKTGDYARTDKSTAFWLAKCPTEEEIKKMIQFLDDKTPLVAGDDGSVLENIILMERITDNNNISSVRFRTTSGRTEGQISREQSRERRISPTRT